MLSTNELSSSSNLLPSEDSLKPFQIGQESLELSGSAKCGLTDDFFKSYQCEYCSKQFTRKENLRNHLDNIHLNIRKYQCAVCDKQFSERANLMVHTRIHTN